MIKANIIFDVGGVLVDFNLKKIIRGLITDPAKRDLYYYVLRNDWVFNHMDSGEFNDYDLIRSVARDLGATGGFEADVLRINNCFTDHQNLLPGAKELFLDCNSKHNVFVLSNFQSRQFRRLMQKFPFISQVSVLTTVSEDVLCAKPNPGIYKRLLMEGKILAEDSVFIDDKQENVAAAHELGFLTILHKSAGKTREQLEKMGLL